MQLRPSAKQQHAASDQAVGTILSPRGTAKGWRVGPDCRGLHQPHISREQVIKIQSGQLTETRNISSVTQEIRCLKSPKEEGAFLILGKESACQGSPVGLEPLESADPRNQHLDPYLHQVVTHADQGDKERRRISLRKSADR